MTEKCIFKKADESVLKNSAKLISLWILVRKNIIYNQHLMLVILKNWKQSFARLNIQKISSRR